MSRRALDYVDVRAAGLRYRREHPAGNRWQRRSLVAFTLFWRLVPLGLVGIVLAELVDAPWVGTVAAGAVLPALWAFVGGTLLAIPGAFVSGQPFFPQAVLPLSARYATQRLHRDRKP